MRFLVTGASGLLGLNIASQAALQHPTLGVVHTHPLYGAPFDCEVADLARAGAPERILTCFNPDVIIHTAALAYPERCEDQPELTQAVNVALPERLAGLAAERSIRFVHISSDAVFDGVRGGYREEDATNPRNVYARSKREAECRVLAANPESLVARVVFYGWSLNGKRSLAEWFYNNLAAGKPVRGFTDAFFCPLEAGDLAALILRMVEAGLTGIYHVVSPECISKYEFGIRIARLFGFDERLISPASVADSGLKASRPANLSLRNDKLVAALKVKIPDQQAGLEKFYRQSLEGYPARIMDMAFPRPSVLDPKEA